MTTAYAAQIPSGPLSKISYSPGELEAGEIEIDVKYCGLCHSDISMINNDWAISQYPLVPGHEIVGTITKIAPSVTNLKLGQTVGIGWHSGFCNTCTHCIEGDHNLCSQAQGTIVSHHGGFADKFRAQATSVIPIPDGLDLSTVGPLFCGGITVFNPLIQFDIPPTAKVAVIGIGGLGHLALQFLNAWGCEVTAFTSSEDKKQEALKLGAHHTLNSRSSDEIEKAAGSFDLIISTVNVKLDWELYINTLKAKGRLHFVGATLEPIEIQAFSLIMAQRSISGSPVGSPATIAKMLDFVKLHNIQAKVELFPMSEVNEAIAHLESGKARYRIVLEN
ncbi:NAD(P)-dependent alcohol dehydrogenase [Lentisphaera profundi]|uniref:NAD(P)-dependent alcohol dehydrogenase n=1 Tax=Lentisphaera profundi TaxID=1658616 RepID=A0ABY7VX12_9BACT|nr:NAD(P)-dependent alcohol dehydrogenase [Lentisphaera profundi]WDE97814.1 NAD(P)-dependent alcohol dehydrogenase [Lentisphaera profundi]